MKTGNTIKVIDDKYVYTDIQEFNTLEKLNLLNNMKMNDNIMYKSYEILFYDENGIGSRTASVPNILVNLTKNISDFDIIVIRSMSIYNNESNARPLDYIVMAKTITKLINEMPDNSAITLTSGRSNWSDHININKSSTDNVLTIHVNDTLVYSIIGYKCSSRIHTVSNSDIINGIRLTDQTYINLESPIDLINILSSDGKSIIRFISNINTSINIPDNCSWYNNTIPTIEPDKIYVLECNYNIFKLDMGRNT